MRGIHHRIADMEKRCFLAKGQKGKIECRQLFKKPTARGADCSCLLSESLINLDLLAKKGLLLEMKIDKLAGGASKKITDRSKRSLTIT